MKRANAFLIGLTVVWMAAAPSTAWGQSAVWLPQGATTGNIYYNGGNVGIGTTAPAYKLDAVSGFSHFGYNTNGAIPPSDNVNGGLIVGWNRSTGGAEVNLYNAFDAWGPFATSFVFSQKTSPTTYVDLMTLKGQRQRRHRDDQPTILAVGQRHDRREGRHRHQHPVCPITCSGPGTVCVH